MQKTILLFGLLFVTIFSSCKQNDDVIDPQNPLIGTWVYKDYEQINSTEYAIVYERKSKFDDNNSGISFKVNNQLVERKNIGFCGTPPISFGEYEGSYSLKDKFITIDSKGWDGQNTQRYEIITLDDKMLKINILK